MADLRTLLRPASSRILLVVLDGLGGYADSEHGSELEEAITPELDRLAAEGVLGLHEPVGPGITPGSGPGHLALFGYDPLETRIGRGALTAAGMGVELGEGDVSARGNLCLLAGDGTIADRRAGRIADGQARALAEALEGRLRVEGVGVEVHHVKEHRLLLVLRGELDARVADTDPHREGVHPHRAQALTPEAETTARIVAEVSDQARHILQDEDGADALLLRGFSGRVELPSLHDRLGVQAAAAAGYPMYRGVASLVGMEVLRQPASVEDACQVVEDAWGDHDFFFLHHKDPDKAGEDGDREAKQRAISAFDAVLPRLRSLGPDVIAVTGDHATPSQSAAHSWHPVPVLMWNGRERDEQTRFGESTCRAGALGLRRGVELMPLMLAMAGRLDKYGA